MIEPWYVGCSNNPELTLYVDFRVSYWINSLITNLNDLGLLATNRIEVIKLDNSSTVVRWLRIHNYFKSIYQLDLRILVF